MNPSSAHSLPSVSWGLPHDASVYGWRVDWLMATTTLFVTLMFIVTVVWILSACLMHGPRHPAHYDAGNGRATVIKALALSAAVFLVVDGNLFIHGLQDLGDAFWNFDKASTRANAVRIEINAHQWAWDARYAGPDGVFNTADDIVTLNDIRVPVGRPVLLELASTDVVHCFSLPNFRIKQDVVPGSINRLWFEAKETGVFDIACAQHCGVHHYKMRGTLSVLDDAGFSAWHGEATALSARAYDVNDVGAHWGWDWDRHARASAVASAADAPGGAVSATPEIVPLEPAAPPTQPEAVR